MQHYSIQRKGARKKKNTYRPMDLIMQLSEEPSSTSPMVTFALPVLSTANVVLGKQTATGAVVSVVVSVSLHWLPVLSVAVNGVSATAFQWAGGRKCD